MHVYDEWKPYFDGEQFKGFSDGDLYEIREGFVWSRFGEGRYFGDPGIEEWLVEEPPASDPLWQKVLSLVSDFGLGCTEQPTEALRMFGARYPTDCDELPKPFHRPDGRFGLAHVLERGSYDVYLAPKMIFLLQCHFGKAMTFWNPDATPAKNVELDFGDAIPRESMAAYSALYAWRHANSSMRQRMAGEFVRRCAQHCVAAVRAAAEEDFNNAVAISIDGTKIFCVDEVWVDKGEDAEGDRISVYAASRFLTQKIFLDTIVVAKTLTPFKSRDALLECVGRVRQPNVPQFFAKVEDRKVFFTAAHYLPQGMEVPA